MKVKRLIKRVLAWIGVAAMPLAFVGCANAPGASVAAKTNTSQIVEQAQSEGSAAAVLEDRNLLAERIGAPEQLTWENASADGKLTVSIDAPVFVPENDLPIIRVEPAQFSQETVDRFYQGLVGDVPMYKTVYERTKSELEDLLAYYRGVLVDESTSASDKDFAQDYIKDFETQLTGAPETITPVLGTSKLKRIAERADGITIYHDGVDLMNENRTCFFSVENDREITESISWDDVEEDGTVSGSATIPVMRNARLSYSVTTGGVHDGDGHDTVWIGRNEALPEYTQGLIKLTPAEAAAQAGSILMRIGVADTFDVTDIYLCSDRHPGWNVPEATGYYYRITCTRRIGDIPCVAGMGSGSGRNSTYWGAEGISIRTDDCGVEHVGWDAPVNILETVSDAAQLRPFSEILEIAQKILPMEFESEARDEYHDSVEVKIDRVTLSLQRIVEQGQPFSGLLIPVWNFYGARMISSGERPGSSDFKFGSMLSVNAVDGNVIDVERGY